MSTEPASNKSNPVSWDDVRRLAEEIRLKVHLAGMDLKDRWHELEPELHKMEERLRETGEKAEGAVTTQFEAIGAGLRKLVDELRDSLGTKR